MKKSLLILIFVMLVLVGTTWLLDARADDTYNFYFQKAPGPVTVNQGAAASSTPDLKLKNETVVPVVNGTAPASVASVSAPPAAPEESGEHHWQLALGVAGSRYGGGSSPDNSYYYMPQSTQSGMINAGQAAVSLQGDLSEFVGVQVSSYYLAKAETRVVNGQEVSAQGSRFDYGADFVVTPFHIRTGNSLRLLLSALIGGETVPYHTGGFDSQGAPDGTVPTIAHAGTLAYGGRASFELGARLAIQATVRRLDRYSATQGVASLAFLL